jgi:hypothetical protein
MLSLDEDPHISKQNNLSLLSRDILEGVIPKWIIDVNNHNELFNHIICFLIGSNIFLMESL